MRILILMVGLTNLINTPGCTDSSEVSEDVAHLTIWSHSSMIIVTVRLGGGGGRASATKPASDVTAVMLSVCKAVAAGSCMECQG